MASENRASFTKIGLTVVLGTIAVLGTLIYFGGVGGRDRVFFAETYYRNPVSGLSVGSEVNFRGVKVGEVREISFIGSEYEDVAEDDYQVIYIKLAFDTHLCRFEEGEDPSGYLQHLIAKGLRATVSSSGVTGLSKLELNLPKGEIVPPPPISWTPDLICIPPAPSMLESFSDSVTRVMSQLNKVDFTSAWSNVSTVATSIAQMSRDLGSLVESQKSNISGILSTVDEATRSLKEFADTVRENPSLLLRPADADPLPETQR